MAARNDQQLAQLCRYVLARSEAVTLFTDDGPTERAVEILEADRYLSSGTLVMLKVAFTLWRCPDGAGVDLVEVLTRLDRDNFRLVLAAVAAFRQGPEAIDQVLAGETAH